MLAGLEIAKPALIAAGRSLAARGWVPASSGNLSQRLNDGRIAITVSGRAKGELGPDDITVVEADGQPTGVRPSAETLLHAQLYRVFPKVQAVVHTHARFATVLSRRRGEGTLELAGYELLKAFRGIDSHEQRLAVPIFANDQDIARLARRIEPALHGTTPLFGYLLAGHGLYTWGEDFAEALRHAEAFEFLFECELLAERDKR